MKRALLYILGVLAGMSSACNHLLEDYELDTNPDFLDSVSLIPYIDQGGDTSLTLYAEAVHYAGIESLLKGEEKTRIVPNNTAIRQLLVNAGVERIQELSPNVVRDLFSYLVIPGTFISSDMPEGEMLGDVTPRGDSLFLTRSAGEIDKYRLLVNQNAALSGNAIQVIGQDYVFDDGIAHIVNQFPIYRRLMKPTDEAPDDVDYSQAQQDTLWVQSDSHILNAYKNNNYGDGTDLTRSIQLANGSWKRQGLMMFDIEAIDFADDLVGASLNIYAFDNSNDALEPIVGVYETDTDWQELEVTWNNMPAFGKEVAKVPLEINWNRIDITSLITQAYTEDREQVSLGLILQPDAGGQTGTIFIRSREQEEGKFKAYISLLGALETELILESNQALQVKSGDAAVLTEAQLSMKAQTSAKYNYTDNNIIYTLTELPAQGTLTLYGLPLSVFGEFTQQELKNGAVKYVHEGQGTSDLLKFKVKDYIGGVYASPIEIAVQIQ